MTFGTSSTFGTKLAKCYGDNSEIRVYIYIKNRKRHRQWKTTAVAKYYGFRRQIIFGMGPLRMLGQDCLGYFLQNIFHAPEIGLRMGVLTMSRDGFSG